MGLQLLDFAQYGRLPDEYTVNEQADLLKPLQKLISEDGGGDRKVLAFKVVHAILKKPDNTSSKMYLNPYDLADWLPNAFMTYRNL